MSDEIAYTMNGQNIAAPTTRGEKKIDQEMNLLGRAKCGGLHLRQAYNSPRWAFEKRRFCTHGNLFGGEGEGGSKPWCITAFLSRGGMLDTSDSPIELGADLKASSHTSAFALLAPRYSEAPVKHLVGYTYTPRQ